MSVAFTKEEDTEAAASYLPERPVSPHTNFVTATGLEQLDAALAAAKEAVASAQGSKELQSDRSPMARAMRDLRYYTARRVSAQLLEPKSSNGEVVFGSRIRFRRDDGRVQTFRIVGEDEADATQGTVSYISPIAKALLGKKHGDIAMLANSELEIIQID